MNKISTFLSTLFAFFGLIAGAHAQCAAGEVAVTAEVSTDTWGYELYWEVTPDGDACGVNTIAFFGNPGVGCAGGAAQTAANGNAGAYPNNAVTTEDLGCMSSATCVTIHMVDDWGDGSCALQFYSDGIAADAFTASGANDTFTFCPQEAPSFDASVSTAAEYTIVPLNQVFAIGSSATIINSGGSTITNAVVTVSVLDDLNQEVYTESSSPVSVLATESSVVSFSGYVPASVGSYTTNFTVTINETDADAGNDVASSVLIVDELTYARDDSEVSNFLGINGGSFVAGNTYDFVNSDIIESISIFHSNPNAGDTIELIVHAVDIATGLPGALLGTSGFYTLTADDITAAAQDGALLTRPVLNNDGGLLSVAPGAYFVGCVQVSLNNASLGLSDNIYTPGKILGSINGGEFLDMADVGFTGAWMVRPNMSACGTLESTDTQISCGSFEWIDGETYAESNNTATFVITTSEGCDSTVTLDLTVNGIDVSTDVQTSCEPIVWIDGETYAESNNTATFVLQNANGCDSTVTLDLTVYGSTETVDVQATCEPYTWIDGNEYTESNNTATFMATSVNGCDSLVTLDLTVADIIEITDVQISCGEFTWTDGVTYSENNNTASQSLQSVSGCDSIVTLDLTIYSADASTDVQASCGEFTWIDGNVYSESNDTATITLQTVAGCDSIVTLNLTVNAFQMYKLIIQTVSCLLLLLKVLHMIGLTVDLEKLLHKLIMFLHQLQEVHTRLLFLILKMDVRILLIVRPSNLYS
jgi:hypothetical protein